MKKNSLYALLIVLSLTLSGCANEKEINMNNNAPIVTPFSSNSSNTPSITINPDYVEYYGETLAPFHNKDWEQDFSVNDDGIDYNISIDIRISVTHPFINTVTFINFLQDDDNFRSKCFDTFFGDLNYSHQESIFPYENAYNRASLGRDHLVEMIQKDIDDGVGDEYIEGRKNQLRSYESYIGELKESYQKKLKEVNNNPELTEDPNAFFAHNPSGNGIISLSFDHNAPDTDHSYTQFQYADELDNFDEVNITGLPAPFNIYNGNNIEKLEFLNSILEKLDLPLCSTEEGSYESGICEAYMRLPRYECYNYEGVDTLSFECFPPANSTFPISYYSADFNGETVNICIAYPCHIIQSIDNVPLLSLDEIKAIAKNELSRNVSEYKKYAEKNHELTFRGNSIALQSVIHAESNSVIPAWCFYTNNFEWGSTPIFYINAIDGSVYQNY